MNKKLRVALRASIRKHAIPPFTEVSLGKLLTDVRKLLEEQNETEKYPMLKLFCDWALHSKLSGKKIQKLLSKIDEIYDSHLIHNIPLGNEIPELIGHTLSLYTFESQLAAFLKTCSVNVPDYAQRRQWQHFEEIYCSIVGECLFNYQNKNKPLKHIDSAQFSLCDTEPAEQDQRLSNKSMVWIFFKDEKEVFRRTLTFEWKQRVSTSQSFHLKNVPRKPVPLHG